MTATSTARGRSHGAVRGLGALLAVAAAMGVGAASVELTSQDGAGLGVLAAVPFVAAAVSGVGWTVVAGAVSLAVALGAARYERLAWGVDLQFVLGSIVVATLLAIATAALRRRRLQQLSHSRHVADVVQQTLLHPVPQALDDVVVATHYSSATSGAQVGGDLYDLQRTPYGIRLVVGDVRGKGLPAVRLASVALSSFREWCYHEPTLAGVAARVDASIARHAGPEEFVTAALVEVGPDVVTVVNCGHVPPLLIDAGVVSAVEPSDPSLPLGLGATPSPHALPFAPGARLLLYTDGVTEARRRNRTFDLASEFTRSDGTDAHETVHRLYSRLRRFARRRLDDDVAILLLERARTSDDTEALPMLTDADIQVPPRHATSTPAS